MIISRAAIRRPVTVVMTFVGLAIIGVFAAFKLPIEQFPEMESPYVSLSIPYGNASPREIEQNIARPVEEILSTMSGIDTLTTSSRPGSLRVGILLTMDGDTTAKGTEAKELIESIRHILPDDMQRVQLRQWDPNESPVMNVLIVAEGLDQDQAFDILDTHVRAELERVPGVNSVSLYGILRDNVRIILDPSRIAAYGLDFSDIRNRLQQANFYMSAGKVESGPTELRVRPLGKFEDLDDIRSLPINNRGLVLADVATVTMAPDDEDWSNDGNRANGEDALGISVYKRPEANMVEVSRALERTMARIKEGEQFAGTTFYALDSQAETVMESLTALRDSGLLGGLLSVIVLFLFLRRVNVSLLIASTIPLSLCATLGIMYFLDMSVNTLSLVGLMLTIGLLVDNSVVVSEAITIRRRDAGTNARAAADAGVTEVGLAITAGTLTTVIVFVPSFMSDSMQVAMMQQNIATPLCAAILASLLIAQTLVPSVMARVPLPKQELRHPVIDGIARYYEIVVRQILSHRLLGVIAMAAIAASGWWAYQQLTVDMNPAQETPRLELRYRMSGSNDIKYVEEYVQRVDEYLMSNRERFEIENIFTRYDGNDGNTTINLRKDGILAPGVIEEMIMEGIPEQPAFRLYFRNKSRGFGGSMSSRGKGGRGDAGLSMRIIGDSTGKLLTIADDIVALLEQQPLLKNVSHDGETSSTEMRISIQHELAGNLGINARSISRATASALGGQNMPRGFVENGREIEILLEMEGQRDADLNTVKRLPILLPDGSTVPLETVADISFDSALRGISRENRETSLNVSFATIEGESPLVARETVEGLMGNYELPAGYRWQFGKDFEFDSEMMQEMALNLVLAILLIYMLMAALFESVLFPTTVIIAIGFSVVGACWTLLLTGTTMTAMALTGMLLLAGIVVNNGIVLLNRIIQLRQQGHDRLSAIVASGRHRLRPILMTVCTTAAGMLPLAIGEVRIGGSGPAYFPMARTLIGGLTFSTIITLLILPLMYVLFDDLKNSSIRFWREARRRAAAPTVLRDE